MTGAPLSLLALPGDGVGPEIMAATLEAARAAAERAGVAMRVEERAIGFASLAADGVTLTDAVVAEARAADGVILGPVSHNAYPPVAEGGLNPSGELRRRLDLFANLRPAVTPRGVRPATGVPLDLVIFRENTEGFYADRNMHLGPGEVMPTEDVALAIRRVTRRACLRIAESAFLEARRRKRRDGRAGRVTAVHKANVLRVSDGLFLACVREVAARYADVALEEVLVDAMCAHLVRAPDRFDVICTTNMYGDILSDLAAELAGGLGLAASINAGDDAVIAQAQHGSAPDIAGQDRANASSLIGSVALLFRELSERRGDADLRAAADALSAGLDAALSDPNTRTRDLGGPLGCAAFGSLVAERIRA